jgi:hypothetical protein
VSGRRRAPASAALLLLSLALAAVLPDAADAKDAEVRVFSSGNKSELIEKLPITPKPGAEARKVMRIGPGRMPGLRSGDVLRAGVELQLTNACLRDAPHCVGPNYSFSPKVEGELLLQGPGVRRRVGAGSETCGQSEPHREHHCVLVIEPHARTIRPGDVCEKCRLSLFVSASDPRASGAERILIGGNKPDGSIPQDRGRITATLLRKGAPQPRVGHTSRLRLKDSPIDKKRHVVLSKRVRGLRRGEQLEVSAHLRTTISRLPYTVRTTSQLVLARSPRAVEPDRRTARIALLNGEIDESNGFNCVLPAGSCTVRKLGVTRVDRSAHRLFVNLVLLSGPKRAAAHAGDASKLSHAELTVRRYPPPKGRKNEN